MGLCCENWALRGEIFAMNANHRACVRYMYHPPMTPCLIPQLLLTDEMTVFVAIGLAAI